jgi:hypothetical protein
METWQFSLFFVALLIGYALVHVRLTRVEEHLRHLAGIRTLDERLLAILERLDKAALTRVEPQLQRLHEDLEDLREATVDVKQAVVAIPPPPSRIELASMPAIAVEPNYQIPTISRSERLRGVVETRLLQLGHAKVQLLTDLSSLPPEGDVEVVFEAERQHMPVKGRVLLRNDSVRDVVVHSAASMFP